MNRIYLAWACAASAFAAVPAGAATYLYTLTGDLSATFSMASTPLPAADYGGAFLVEGLTGSSWDGASNFHIDFFSAGWGGGYAICDDGAEGCVPLAGPQLYTGTTAAPIMALGTFDLTFNDGDYHATLIVSDATVAAVPESATWAAMVVGFGAIGSTMRRRNARIAFA